jgi:hypothetical protein
VQVPILREILFWIHPDIHMVSQLKLLIISFVINIDFVFVLGNLQILYNYVCFLLHILQQLQSKGDPFHMIIPTGDHFHMIIPTNWIFSLSTLQGLKWAHLY